MSYFIDTKYLNQIGHRLPQFKKKKPDVWNCRCILCGDSTTNSKKARGYFYRVKNDLNYKCHNCGISMHFGTFLKRLDTSLYSQYVFERYTSGENGPKAHTDHDPQLTFKEPTPSIDLDNVMQRLDTLPEDNEAVQYCRNRQIPIARFDQLYFISAVKDIKQIAPKYETLQSPEPRLALPLYNDKLELTGVSMRALRGEHLRYLTIKVAGDEDPLIFGMDRVDVSKPITVVEGPIDSLFLNNAIAVCGTSFSKLESLDLPKEQLTIVFDNEPRNVEVCKLIEKYIMLEYQVCIWPCGIKEKDINDMVQAGREPALIIGQNTHQGLMARLKFAEWKNC